MRTQIDETLKDFLNIYEDSPTKEAVEYSLLSGGKRVRPLLLLSLLKDYKEDPALGLDVAMALELIQT